MPTTPMAMTGEPKLSARDVCAILRTCHKLKIKRLTYGDLEVVFEEAPSGGSLEPLPQFVRAASLIDDKTMAEMALRSKEEDLALLAIEDPLAYQQHMLGEDTAPDEDFEEYDEA